MGRNMTRAEIEQEISALLDLPRADLVEQWLEHCRCDLPKGLSTQLMIRGIAYQMQAKHCGGLKPATKRRLRKSVTARSDNKSEGGSTRRQIEPGARLVREWNGVTHTVDVTDNGFDWRGEQYGSLSEIARKITGARWSGPRFFGLNGRATP